MKRQGLSHIGYNATRVGALFVLASSVLGGLTTCTWPTFCNNAQVAFTLPTPADSLAFDAFLCIEGGKDGGPSFDVSVNVPAGAGAPFAVSFIDPRRPGEIISGSFGGGLSSAHCDEGIRVEVYREDDEAVSASGFVQFVLSVDNPEVCTIELQALEGM